jgi:hypothetical protein
MTMESCGAGERAREFGSGLGIAERVGLAFFEKVVAALGDGFDGEMA